VQGGHAVRRCGPGCRNAEIGLSTKPSNGDHADRDGRALQHPLGYTAEVEVSLAAAVGHHDDVDLFLGDDLEDLLGRFPDSDVPDAANVSPFLPHSNCGNQGMSRELPFRTGLDFGSN